MDDLEKQYGTSPTLYHSLCIISTPSVISNWSYGTKTLNAGQNRQFLSFVTLKFDLWSWKTILHLFYTTSLCIISKPYVNLDWRRGPIEIKWRGSVVMPCIPIHCKCMGGPFVWSQLHMEASVSYGYVRLSMLAGNLVNWWKLAPNSRFICGMQQRKSFKCSHVNVRREICHHSQIKFTDDLPTFPKTKSLWSYLKLLLICLLELGFGFDRSLPRGKPVGKSLYYHSFNRRANWSVWFWPLWPWPLKSVIDPLHGPHFCHW